LRESSTELRLFSVRTSSRRIWASAESLSRSEKDSFSKVGTAGPRYQPGGNRVALRGSLNVFVLQSLGLCHPHATHDELQSSAEGEINGKPKQCAPAASCRAQAGTVTSGEVGSSDFSNRVIKWFGNGPASEPTDASNIGSFTAQDGTGTEGEMGKG